MKTLSCCAVCLALASLGTPAAQAQVLSSEVSTDSSSATKTGWLPPVSYSFVSSDGSAPLREDYLYEDAPNWTIWGGAIFLTRSQPQSQSLIRSGGNSIFNARQLNFGTAAGPDINAIRHGEVVDLGFRFFQVNSISAQRTIIPGFNSQLDINDPIDLGSDILGQLYTSSILSVELNARRNITDRLTLLAGFRYLQFEEDLRTRFDLPLDLFPAINVDVDGINRLYGGQVGADAILLDAGRFQILSAAKAGIYGNTARNAARLSIDGDGNFSYGRSTAAVSFVGDLNFTGVFQLTDVWAIRGGYQLLWLSGVALASQQYPHVSHHFIPNANVVTGGDVFLHGALVSVEAAW